MLTLDTLPQPAAEAEGGTGTQQGQGAGHGAALGEVVADVIKVSSNCYGIPDSKTRVITWNNKA